MTYGIKVAKTGKSVTSTNPDDFIFNSEYETIKIYDEPAVGSSVSVGAGSSTTVTITHNLGFAPMCWLFTELATGHYYCGVCLPSKADGFPSGYAYVGPNSAETYSDTTYFKFKIYNTTGATKTVKYFYFIFGDDGL